MDYKQILEDVLELDERITIIRGFGDIIIDDYLNVPLLNNNSKFSTKFRDFNKNNYWILLGRGTDEMIVETMSEIGCDVDREGEYEFKAVLKWVPGDYDERDCPTIRDYLEVEHIEFDFIQTFQQRERQEKLNLVLSKELEDLFKF